MRSMAVLTTLLDLLGVALTVAAVYLLGGLPAGLLLAGVWVLVISWMVERRRAAGPVADGDL